MPCTVLLLKLHFGLPAAFPSLPYFVVSKQSFHTLVLLIDVITGVVVMVTFLQLRRILPPILHPLQHLPSNILTLCFKYPLGIFLFWHLDLLELLCVLMFRRYPHLVNAHSIGLSEIQQGTGASFKF